MIVICQVFEQILLQLEYNPPLVIAHIIRGTIAYYLYHDVPPACASQLTKNIYTTAVNITSNRALFLLLFRQSTRRVQDFVSSQIISLIVANHLQKSLLLHKRAIISTSAKMPASMVTHCHIDELFDRNLHYILFKVS
jgi:hypothetical protein